MRVQVYKEQVAGVIAFRVKYPTYSNVDILEIAATPKFIPQMYKEAELLKSVTLNELAMILNGHYDVIDQGFKDPVWVAIENNPVLSVLVQKVKDSDAPQIVKDMYVNSFYTQTKKGIEKYGAPVDYKSLSPIEWLQHEIEEATDGLVYKQALLLSLKEAQKPKPCSHENLEYWNHGYHNRCKDCGEVDVK